jgi:hypothetical protein
VRYKPAKREVNALVLYARAIVVNERIGYDWNNNLVAQNLLNHPFADMNAFDMPDFPPFMEVKLYKAVLERFSGHQFIMCIDYISQTICVIPLDTFFPGDIFHAVLKRLV